MYLFQKMNININEIERSKLYDELEVEI